MPESMQDSLAVVVAWLDAMRRRDMSAVAKLLDPDVRWRAVPPDAVCANREDVMDMLDAVPASPYPNAGALELVAGDGAVMLGVRADALREIGGVALPGQLFNVFHIEAGRIVAVEDYAHRAEALRAAMAVAPDWA